MNENLRTAINMAKYIKGVVIEYRSVNNSIYRGSINYIGTDSLDGFINRTHARGDRVEAVKVIEDYTGGKNE